MNGEAAITDTSIPALRFRKNAGLSSYAMTEGLLSIGDAAFSYCTSLKELVIPATVQYIGVAAFCCSGIENITFKGKPKEVERAILKGCSRLNAIVVPKGCKEYFVNLFEENKDIIVEATNDQIGHSKFDNMKPEEIKSQLQAAYDLRDKMKGKYGKVLPEQDAEIQELERKFLEDYLKPELDRYAKELLQGVRYDVNVDVSKEDTPEDETLPSASCPTPPAYSGASSRKVNNPSKRIRVTFANGKSFCESNSIKTLIVVLEYIGFAKVAQLDIKRCGYSLVGKIERPPMPGRMWQHKCNGWYIYCNTSNKAKIEDLNKIAKELNIQMVITEL